MKKPLLSILFILLAILGRQALTAFATESSEEKMKPDENEYSGILVLSEPLNSPKDYYDVNESMGGGTARLICGGSLTFIKNKNYSLLLKYDGQEVLCVNGEAFIGNEKYIVKRLGQELLSANGSEKVVIDTNDYMENKASEYMKISGDPNIISVSGLNSQWKETFKEVEGTFAGVLFRSDDKGELVPGLFTTEKSKIYIPSKLFNTPLEFYMPCMGIRPVRDTNAQFLEKNLPKEIRWPYRSSTDIVLEAGPYGTRIASGRIEFLLIKQKIVPNFGDGAKVKILQEAIPTILVNGDGSVEKVIEAGAFICRNGAWKKQEN